MPPNEVWNHEKNVLTMIFTTAKIELQINNVVEIKETMITKNCDRSRKPFRKFMYRGAKYKGCNRTIGRSFERMNLAFNGVISWCNVCESTHHWAKDCLHTNKSVNMTENINLEETVHMTLMTEAKQLDKISNQDVLVMEARDAAIVDTACSNIVCGNEWLQYLLDSQSFEK